MRDALSSRSCRGKRSARLLVGAGDGGGRRRDVEEQYVVRIGKPEVESNGFQPPPRFLSQIWLRSHTGFSLEGAVRARVWASWDRLGRTVVVGLLQVSMVPLHKPGSEKIPRITEMALPTRSTRTQC